MLVIAVALLSRKEKILIGWLKLIKLLPIFDGRLG